MDPKIGVNMPAVHASTPSFKESSFYSFIT